MGPKKKTWAAVGLLIFNPLWCRGCVHQIPVDKGFDVVNKIMELRRETAAKNVFFLQTYSKTEPLNTHVYKKSSFSPVSETMVKLGPSKASATIFHAEHEKCTFHLIFLRIYANWRIFWAADLF